MEILYGIVILLAFIIGFGIGISVPFFVKKYVNEIIEKNKSQIIEKEEKDTEPITAKNLTKEIQEEWFYGKAEKSGDDINE